MILSRLCQWPRWFAVLFFVWFTLPVVGQSPGDTRPVTGLRENPPDIVALQDARIVTAPGEEIEKGTVIIRGSTIESVGPEVQPPPGAHLIDCDGKTIYAGLIDAWGEVDVDAESDRPGKYWNGNILPQRKASSAISSVDSLEAYRGQGVTLRLVAPRGAIIKGSSCLMILDGSRRGSLLQDDVAQHVQLTVPRDQRRDDYPNSPMGATALLRQTLADADWYSRAWSTYRSQPGLQRPDRNEDLQRLAADMRTKPFVADAQNERMALRADQVAKEFSLDLVLRGSGREYRDLEAIAATGRMVLVPVDFTGKPDVASEAAADDVSLRELLDWHFAPENPARLVDAGVSICLTSDGLDDPKDFLKQLRVAVERGLSADAALAALTTTPARWLGVDSIAGTVSPDSLANLVITDGPLFDEQTNVIETWVAGNRYVKEERSDSLTPPFAGTYQATLKPQGESLTVQLKIERSDSNWKGSIGLPEADSDADESDHQNGKTEQDEENEDSESVDSETETEDADEPQRAELKSLAVSVDRLTAWFNLNEVDDRIPEGASRLTLVAILPQSTPDLLSTLTYPDGTQQSVKWESIEESESDESEADDQADPSEEEDESDDPKASFAESELVVNYPLGAYGVSEPRPTPVAVLFRNMTVWTCSDAGVLEGADVLVLDGKIVQIGNALSPPEDCRIVEAKGKHLTPGLIDCHSHMATDGGVNESGQAVTAEVRIGDFVDNTDVNIYRQLAGGLTMASILHGSANPIGGQNQVIKLRWGQSMDAMKMDSAPGGIKFALGENVKRSNWRSPIDRYPTSRMGVEQIMRDRFLAAQRYDRQWRAWRSGQRDGLPPRVDYELEALAEILNGDRWIHCHSYRQDEIVTLLDLLDRFDVTIGTLQHILEGYKVADRMVEHGAMGSSFSDWWAYKFEVYDAIPYNGAIMHDVGVVVSFNSDSAELARHLNTEAAKATKYGGVPSEEALKFVTLNPAKQLRIDDRVGSIEVGKDADLVIWSGPPLSTLSRCEQTWIEGRLMFSLQHDAELRQRDAKWRRQLIEMVLRGDADSGNGTSDEEVSEEARWLRYDEFCHVHDHDHDDADHQRRDHQHHDQQSRDSQKQQAMQQEDHE